MKKEMEVRINICNLQKAQKDSAKYKNNFKISKKWKRHGLRSVHESFYREPKLISEGCMIQGLKRLRALDLLHVSLMLGSLWSKKQKSIRQIFDNIHQVKNLRALDLIISHQHMNSQSIHNNTLNLFQGLRKLSCLREIRLKLSEETNVHLLDDLSHAISRLPDLQTLKLKLDYNQTENLFNSVARFLGPLSHLKRLKLLISYMSESPDSFESQELWNILKSNTQLEKLKVGLFPKYFQDAPLSDCFNCFLENPNLNSISIESSNWYEEDFTQLSSLFEQLEERQANLSTLKLSINTHYISDLSTFYQAMESITFLSHLKKLTLNLDFQLSMDVFDKISEVIGTLFDRLETLHLVLYLPNNARDNYNMFTTMLEALGQSSLKNLKLKVDYYKVCNEDSILKLFKPYANNFLFMKTFECTLKGARIISSEEISNYLRKGLKQI